MEAIQIPPVSFSPAFTSLVHHPLKFRLFLLKNLPAAFFSGLKVHTADGARAVVSVPYRWTTRNPFRSIYFACLGMAAEMSTGILAMGFTYRHNPSISILVTAIEGKFYKKATGRIQFVCEEGQKISATIDRCVLSREPLTCRALSSGFNEQSELVAEFWITWSFRVRK
jgi:hypothetical protein